MLQVGIRRRRLIVTASVFALALLLLLASGTPSATADPGTTERVSVDSAGNEGNGRSGYPSISGDGRFVAFQSDASNLVPDDTNHQDDIFAHDRLTGTTERVSVDSAGNEGDGGSEYPSISGDGRFVAFQSDASNLVPGDTNHQDDIFVHDRLTDTTERVSVDSAGNEANSDSGRLSISGDGRFVAFISWASNLVPNDTNGTWDAFVHDRETGTTERVSVDSSGGQANANSQPTAISGDGRFVAFQSVASNLVPGDTNWEHDIFVHDRLTDTTERVSVDSAGNEANSDSGKPSISHDGRFVAFHSLASNLVSDDTNRCAVASGSCVDVFVRDRQTGTTERVSVDSEGNEGNDHSSSPCISAGGRYVAFNSENRFEPEDTNLDLDIYLHDRQTRTTELVTPGSSSDEFGSFWCSLSGDGRFVAFASGAYNLVPNDSNAAWDVFVRDRGAEAPSQVDRDIVFVRGIDSVGDCGRAEEWVEEYLESSTRNPFYGKVRIGKYLHFDYLSGGSYDCPRDGNAYTKADTCDGVARAAGELKGLIEAQATAQVTIVAHSMGGLVAAYLVGNWPEWAESHVASVVTIDGTLRGISDIDAWLLEYPSVCSLDWPTPSASLLELVETSSVVEKAATAAEKVPFYPMDATQFPNYVPRERSTLDGARPFSLTNWCEQPGADEQECEPPRPIDDDHSSSWDRRFDEHSENAKAFLVGCAASVMVDCAFMSAPALQGMTTETHAAMGPTATQVRIVSNYGSIVRMTIISPDGTVYGPDGAGPLLAYGVDEVSETYVIGNPAPGDWTIQLFGEDVDPGGEEVLLTLLVEEASEDADFDGDGFTNYVELHVGTDPLDDCPDNPSHDAWPLDLNMDSAITVAGDALSFRGRIGASPGSPQWWQRLDLNTDDAITVVGDALLYRGMIGESCTNP